MPTYVFECQVCSQYTEEQFRIADMPDSIDCGCGGNAVRIIQAPEVLKASYPDGHKRKGWSELREASTLTKEKRGTRDKQEQKRIANQIRKLGVNITKDGV